MVEKIQQSEVYVFFVKIIFPAFIGVGIKIAIEMKKNKTKISFFNVCASMLIGVGGAYLASGIVQSTFSHTYIPMVIAIIAIISDKIAAFLLFKLNVDLFLTAFFNNLFDMLSETFNRKK